MIHLAGQSGSGPLSSNVRRHQGATMRIASVLFAMLTSLASIGALAADGDIERVGWLAGCWRGELGEPGTIEQWLAPAGDTMLGVSRTVKQGKTVEFEFMQLRQLPDGVLAFIAQPSGRPPTIFRALSLRDHEVVFENPNHDFPQRVSYSRPEESRLLASIEGVRNGVARKIEFPFTRVSCDAAATGAVR